MVYGLPSYSHLGIPIPTEGGGGGRGGQIVQIFKFLN